MASKKFDIGKEIGLSLAASREREWTQDFVEEVKIIDGVVVREGPSGNKHYVKILEFSAVNFAIMSEAEQDALIARYMGALRSLPQKFHIKIITTQTNVEEYIAAAREALEEEKNSKCRRFIGNYINYLTGKASMQTFRKHYYFIYEYEPPLYGKPATTERDIIHAVNARAKEITDSFKSLGNALVVKQGSENAAVAELIYDHYNRGICRAETFKDRTHRIVSDIRKINGMSEFDELPDADFKTMLAPKSIDFNESPDYVVIDGIYKSHFFIPGERIPSAISTTSGWFPKLSNFGEGFDLDLFFYKGDTAKKLNSLRGKIVDTSYDATHTSEEAMNAKEKRQAYTDVMFLKDALSEGEEIYEMSILLSTQSRTLQELHERKAFLKKNSIEMNIPILECKRFQEEAFFSTNFTVDITPKIYNLTHRNITSSGVAATYAMTAFLLRDPEGIALGYNMTNRSLVIPDPYSKRYKNANFCIYGAPGGGKTFSLMTITSRLRCHGIQQFILAPEKQHEFIPLCHELGGEFVDISPASQQRVNLFDIRPKDSPEMDFIADGSYVENSWLIEKVEAVKLFCNYLIPNLSLAEKVQLETIALNMYKDFGITENNESIYIDDDKTRLKPMPIMSDFYERIKADRSINPDITTILSQFVSGAARSMNGHTNVDLDNKYLVFGLENIKGDLLAPTMFIILDYVWGKCREDRTKKKMIAIDELWKLLDPRNPLVGDFVVNIFKLIRGYGGGAMSATQSIADNFRAGSNFGNTILSCSNSKILLGMEQKDLQLLMSEIDLTPAEASGITNYSKGQAILCAGSNHIPIQVEASPYEASLFETERSALAKKLANIRKDKEEEGKVS